MSERKVLRSILHKRKSFADLTTSARVSLYLILYNTRTLQSSRVLVLQGALCECCGDYDKAEEVYKKVLEENEAHQVGDERERERERSRDRFPSVTFSFVSNNTNRAPPC